MEKSSFTSRKIKQQLHVSSQHTGERKRPERLIAKNVMEQRARRRCTNK